MKAPILTIPNLLPFGGKKYPDTVGVNMAVYKHEFGCVLFNNHLSKQNNYKQKSAIIGLAYKRNITPMFQHQLFFILKTKPKYNYFIKRKSFLNDLKVSFLKYTM